MRSDDLSGLWQQRWPGCRPLAYELKHAYRDRWVRFDSLPMSKRYPETAEEYGIVLDRYNTVVDELFTEQEIYLITCDWSSNPEPSARPDDHAQWHLDARYWTWSALIRPRPTPSSSPTPTYSSAESPGSAALSMTFCAVADNVTAGVMIADLSLERIHHPYDGGADVLLPSGAERDTLMHRHTSWLSQHPQGF
ncbi:DUF3885 domain-containing protein [Nocardia amamiensis]|uniref:DUF3885 domain-containing protein n=1 Tax=Nocardia amamiensis TaxID=404578 RepID=UPI001E2D6566|nr:hypothetical protein [Nocardia amamiensis]